MLISAHGPSQQDGLLLAVMVRGQNCLLTSLDKHAEKGILGAQLPLTCLPNHEGGPLKFIMGLTP